MCMAVDIAIYWTMNNLLGYILLEKTDSPCPTSHQLPINPQVGVRPYELLIQPPDAGMLAGLILYRFCLGD